MFRLDLLNEFLYWSVMADGCSFAYKYTLIAFDTTQPTLTIDPHLNARKLISTTNRLFELKYG